MPESMLPQSATSLNAFGACRFRRCEGFAELLASLQPKLRHGRKDRRSRGSVFLYQPDLFFADHAFMMVLPVFGRRRLTFYG
jgi:hypothetical protein